MASVSVSGAGVYVSAPVLGDKGIANPVPTPDSVPGAVVIVDPSTTAPQAWVIGPNGTYAGVGGSPEGQYGVIRTNATGDDQAVWVDKNQANGVYVGQDPTAPEALVALPNGTYVGAAGSTEGQYGVIRTNATGDDQAVWVDKNQVNGVYIVQDPNAPQAWVVLPDGTYVGAAGSTDGQYGVVRTNASGDDQAVWADKNQVNGVYVGQDPTAPEAWVVLPDGTYVNADGSVQGQYVVVRSNATGDDQAVWVDKNQANAVHVSQDPSAPEVSAALPNGMYVVAGAALDQQVVVVTTNASGEDKHTYISAPSGGGIPDGLPGGVPTVPGGGGLPPVGVPGDLPTVPGLGFAPAFVAGSGADTVVAPGAVVSDLGSATLIGAGGLSTMDPFATAIGGGLVNMGADSVASSALVGSFVQDQALHQLVAPVVETHTAAPATGSVLSLDDGFTTIELRGLGHK